MPIGIFDSSLGIQEVLREPTYIGNMPAAKQMASTVLHEASLEGLYPRDITRHNLEQILCPNVGDGELVRPDTFPTTLSTCLEQLKDNKEPAIRALVREVLLPLQEDISLLKAYTGLMIGS